MASGPAMTTPFHIKKGTIDSLNAFLLEYLIILFKAGNYSRLDNCIVFLRDLPSIKTFFKPLVKNCHLLVILTQSSLLAYDA